MVTRFGTRLAKERAGLETMVSSPSTPNWKRQTRPFAHVAEQMQHALTRLAESDSPVLIAGERGVGKRSIAAQIHAISHRSRNPFIEIHSARCDADSLLSAIAAKGTVYLAEVGELSPDMQELIVSSYLQPGWASGSRLICGASHELLDDVKNWCVREDFFYLVSAVTLRISPLRCRKGEILTIVDDLLTRYSKQFDRPKPVLHEEIVGFLLEHTWPENLTELETAIKTFVAIGDHSISLAALKAAAGTNKSNGLRRAPSLKQATRAASTQIERQIISEVLTATGGNRKRAAGQLGISYKTLLYKIKRAGTTLDPESKGNGVGL
jgi:two-component system, NtrC family, response regulator AtoC